MKNIRRQIMMVLMVFAALIFIGSQAYADDLMGGLLELPIQSQGKGGGDDNQGMKLEGLLSINWYNITAENYADASVVAKLRHGTDEKVFCGVLTGFPISLLIDEPSHDTLLNAITGKNVAFGEIEEQIDIDPSPGIQYQCEGSSVLEYFFGDTTLVATLTSLETVDQTFAGNTNLTVLSVKVAVN
jgi:hypothetical protein